MPPKRRRFFRRPDKGPEDPLPPPEYPDDNPWDPNLPKEDTPFYKEDADVRVVGVKGNRLCENWNEMDFDKQLLINIKKCGFIWPRKVQEVVLPFVADGRDVQCQSETGTGKTASYLIPIIDNLIKEKQKRGRLQQGAPYCIIIAPTREFIEQIFQEARKFAYETGISVAAAYGGKSDEGINDSCNILCACLGRLLHLLRKAVAQKKYLHLLKCVVIDEIDHFLQGNQKNDLIKLFKMLPPANKRQTLFFSPTLHITLLKKVEDEENDRMKKVAEKARKKKIAAMKKENEKNGNPNAEIILEPEKPPEKFILYNHNKRVHITSILDTNQRITYIVDSLDSEGAKFLHLTKRISNIAQEFRGEYPRIIIFVNRIKFADELTKDLTTAGFPADVIHSDLTQEEREEAFSNFKNNETKSRILVSVHLCGCGIDISDMDFVINYNIPDWRHHALEARDTFLQRCGRTGRKNDGTAISFYVESVDRGSAGWLRQILQGAGQEVPSFLEEKTGLESTMGGLNLE